MGDFEKTEIYAGKKTEVILIDQSMANLAQTIQDKFIIKFQGLIYIRMMMPDYS